MSETILVTDAGFAPGDEAPAVALADLTDDATTVEIGPADDTAALAPHLSRLTLIRVRFLAFNDGRGFTHARRLRAMGYAGALRASGHVLADQYAMARRSGFDAVEISTALAARQPEPQWLARADWRAHDYQSRLRG